MSVYKRSRLRQILMNYLGRTGIGKSLSGRLGRSLNDKQWVFILGCYNSGTTLLQRLIMDHPEISGMPAEGVAFTDVIVRPEEYGWPRAWYKCKSSIELDSDYSERGARRLKKQWSWMLEKPRAPLVLEKSIVNVVHAGFLNAYFNRPRFIHLIRNGYAVCEGIHRKALPGKWSNEDFSDKYPIDLCAQQWVETLYCVDQLKADGIDILEVSYEDLTDDPNQTLVKIYKHLGLDNTPLDVASQKWLVHGAEKEIRNMNSDSINRLSDSDKESVAAISGIWLNKYGYK